MKILESTPALLIHRKVSHELWFIDHDEMSFIPERKTVQQESLRPLRSLRLNDFSAPAHERALQPVLYLRLSGAGNILFWREKYNEIV